MNKKKKINRTKVDTVRSVNNNIRSSVRKLIQYLKQLLEKKLMLLLESYNSQQKELRKK